LSTEANNMGKRLSDTEIARWLLAFAILACMAVGGCAAAGYRPPPGADLEPVHGESGGAGGGSM
jgi:hypothetical protein